MSFPIALPGAQADTRLWVDPYSIEHEAQTQLRNISALPWVERLAVMPDVHFGKGATVGSVIAMKNAVSPSAVGVDIGCLDAESEFLSEDGWVRMDEWDGQRVLGYDPDSDTASFVQPNAYIVKDCDEFFYFKNSKGLNQMLSAEHRVLVFSGHRNRGKRKHVVMSPSEVAEMRLDKGYHTFKAAFGIKVDDLDISDAMIRVEIMVQADGRVRQLASDDNYIELHFRRERKIERAHKLLKAAKITYRCNTWKDGSTTFSFSTPGDVATKSLHRYWMASSRQLAIVADECLEWDGHRGYRSFYSSTDKNSADLIQYAFSATGVRAGISISPGRKEGHADTYVVAPTKNEFVGYAQPTKVASKDGKAYCFTVPTGFFVARRGGHVFLTGNCGMAAVKTNLTIDDLPDNLAPLRASIERAVPVGFNTHDHVARNIMRNESLKRTGEKLFAEFETLRAPKLADREKRMKSQAGTLGGGNHFIEVTHDRNNVVWLMLHSGSRNIGKEIAERHIYEAKGLDHNLGLPDRDLAVFLSGTAQMDAYMHDLMWAQRYAAFNREVMLDLVRGVVREHFPSVAFAEPINAHHNYVSHETLMDVGDVIVTRKGAIAAHSGELGLIPGSMGTGSYVVRGLGNESGIYSASHGAGRKMSRSKAKKTFTTADLAAQTAGIECRKDSGVVDEIPGAYKDLEEVIRNQSEGNSPLIEVVERLTTLLCVKG